MPDLYYGISQTGYSIMNQLSKQVLEGFLDRIDALRYVNGNLFVTNPMTGVTRDDDPNRNPRVTTDRVDGTVEFILDPKQVPWPVRNRNNSPGIFASHRFNTDYPRIWEDREKGIVLREQSVPAALNYTLDMTFQTNDAAIRIWDQLQRAIIGEVTTFSFDISYSYPVSAYILAFFVRAWLLRDGYKNQGKSILTYINDFAMERISYDVRTSQLGEANPDRQLMIRRRQLFCQAKISCDVTGPQENRVGNAIDSYHIPLTLQIQFGRPFQLIGTMPIVIDNQFVDGSVFTIPQVTENKNINATLTSEKLRGYFTRNFPGFRIDNAMMVIPPWDDQTFMDPHMESMFFVPFFQIAFTVDGPTTQVDLKNVNGVGMHPVVKDIILAQKADIFGFEGLFNIRVFVDGLPMDNADLTLSDDLVLSIPSFGTHKRYHIVISEATKLTYLNPQYYEYLMKYRYFFPMTIVKNMAFMVQQGFFTIQSGNFLIATVRDLMITQVLYDYIAEWISLGITSEEVCQYCATPAQFADYMTNTYSHNQDAVPVKGSATGIAQAKTYLAGLSVGNPKSLYNAFIATAIARGDLSPDKLPAPYLTTGRGYPYTTDTDSYYGITTPLRIINTGFEC